MLVGIAAPLGYVGEYEGWVPERISGYLLGFVRDCEDLGFESIWLYDHFIPGGLPGAEAMLESFVTAAAIARETSKVRIGHLVACAYFRNAGLTAKMASTLDVLSGGRYILGLGAGW